LRYDAEMAQTSTHDQGWKQSPLPGKAFGLVIESNVS
jgi:hypothetical protein